MFDGPGDLLDLEPVSIAPPVRAAPVYAAPVAAAAPATSAAFDIFGDAAPVPASRPAMDVLASKDGFVIRGAIVRKGGRAVLETMVENGTAGVVGSVRHVRFVGGWLGGCVVLVGGF